MAKKDVVAIRLDTQTRTQVNRLASALDMKPTVLMRRMIERQTRELAQLSEEPGSSVA